MTSTLAAARSETFRSLRYRNFKLFFGGQLISQAGSWMTMIAQTLLILRLVHSTADRGVALGLLTAFQFGPVLLLGAWAGAVADRADKRRLLTILQTAAMLQSTALAVLLFTHSESIAAVYALAAVQGVITSFDNPCRRSFVVEMVPPEIVPNAVSLNSAIMTGSRVVGPAAGGALVLAVGFGWTFLLDAISYLAVIAGLLMMRNSELYSATPTKRAKGQVREGLRYIRSQRELFVPLVMMAIIGTLAFNFSVTIPLLVTGPLHGGGQTFTILFSILSLGSLFGALWTARRKEVTSRQLVVSSAAFGVALCALALSPGLAVAFPFAIVVGLTSIAFMTACTAIVQVLAGPEFRGRVLAIQSMVFLGSTPIGGPIVGWISGSAGPRVGIVVGGVSCLVAAAYGAHALRAPRVPTPCEPITAEQAAIEDETPVALAD